MNQFCCSLAICMWSLLAGGQVGWAQITLDPSFGQQGVVQFSAGLEDQVVGVSILDNGQVMALGQTIYGDPFNGGFDQDYVLARLQPDGQLDLGFGQQGLVQDTFVGFANAAPISLVVRPNGKVVVLGQGIKLNSSARSMIVRQYTADGSLDQGFGQGGQVDIAFLSDRGYPTSLLQLADGKLLIGGYTFDTVGVHRELPFLARLQLDGKLDSSWGTSGMVALDFATGIIQLRSRGAGAISRHLNGGYILDFVETPDGSILAGGAKYTGSYFESTLMQFTPSGQVDSTFGNNGSLLLTPDISTTADHAIKRLALLPDGRLFCLFEIETFVRDFFVGLLDLSQSQVTYSEIDFGGREDIGEAIFLQPDGRVMVIGRSALTSNYTASYPGDQVSICRFATDPLSLDSAFGQGGKAFLPLPTGVPQAGLTVDTDCQGQWMVGGLIETGLQPDYRDFGMWRFRTANCLVSRSPAISQEDIRYHPVSHQLILTPQPFPLHAQGVDPLGRVWFELEIPPGTTQVQVPPVQGLWLLRIAGPTTSWARWLRF